MLTLLSHPDTGYARVSQRRQQATQTALAKFYKQYGHDWTIRLSPDGQRVASMVGSRTKPYVGQPLEKAEQFLKENADAFGFEFSLEGFKVLTNRTTNFGANVELQQVVNGLLIENGRVQVNFDKEGRVVQFVSSYTPAGTPDKDRVTVTRPEAVKRAVVEFLRTTLIHTSKEQEQRQAKGIRVSVFDFRWESLPKVEDVFFARRRRVGRAYKVLIRGVNPFGIKEIIIDANSAAVLQNKDFVYTYEDGWGQVFNPNPVNSLNDPGLCDYCPLPNTNPNPYFTVPLLTLGTATGGAILEGPFVVLRDIQPPSSAPPTASGNPFNFIYRRDEQSFAAVMVYFHVSRNQQYIQDLGFSNVLNRPLWVDAHGRDVNGSLYVSNPGPSLEEHILLGDGGVDDAEDADIIVHEYGHAVQDNQAPGKFAHRGQPKAMGEGFGDYWAFSSYDGETEALGYERFRFCIGEWDSVPNCLRTVNSYLKADDFDIHLSPHRNGQIWSRTLLGIFLLLEKEVTDSLVLQSHFNVPDSPSFVEAADSIIAADWQLYNGAHLSQLCQVFKNRKIYGVSDCPAS
jgi:hypothetical protein